MTRFPTLTRLSECLALGVCVAVTSAGVVTAAPALAAAATVVRGWERGDEPPLLATFARTVRAETARLLAPQLALAAALAGVYVNLVAAANGIPGGSVLRVAAVAAGYVAALSFLAMFPVHAAHGGSWWSSWGRAAKDFGRHPWLPAALGAVLAAAAVLVFAVPIMVVLIGGPVMLAAGVLYSRAAA
ncbi:MAG: hypothetical protein QOD41_4898 [Cryptosporangiaceae bacterium]|nr:hypothetical protein [Cryptosporangiaceae bacterium]